GRVRGVARAQGPRPGSRAERFGVIACCLDSASGTDALAEALRSLTSTAASRDLPDCMPILGHGLWTRDRVLTEADL
ncbi:MAG: hypothetical protein ACRDVE_04790, partial [Actinocrinis sp.]